MYDIKFLNNEKIALISDNTLVYTTNGNINCTSIVTNKRYLILDYPGNIHNSQEDLRISGRMNYIKKKEVILSISIPDIEKIIEEDNYNKIILKNKEYFLVEDKEIIEYLKNKL